VPILDSSLRAGIAGFGLAGEVFHAPLVAAVDGLEVASILTRNDERAARARASHPDARVVADVDALLDGIDVLVVAAPNRSHVELAAAGVERGLHVVVDKPLAPSAAEGRRLLAMRGRVTVFQNRRFDLDFIDLRHRIAAGELGEVFRMESRFERFRPEVARDAWRELPDALEGGGLLLDLGSHLADQAVELFGPPRSVYAELHKRRPGAQVEDDVFVALEHDGGVRSHLWMSATAPLFGPRFRVSGLRAGFASDGLDPQEAELREGKPPRPDGYVRFYEGVRDWARGEAPPPVDPADSLRVLDILEAARRSSERREVQDLRWKTSLREG
jgi:predicted dehydrogenase